jgi:hypothetical protein
MPSDRIPASASLYCMLCGNRLAADDEVCANCGCPIQSTRDDERPRRRRRFRQPVHGILPVIGTILVFGGIGFFIAATIADDMLRRNPLRDIVPMFLVLIGILIEAAAIGACVWWLYQAWRAVSHEDDEYSPGLMVGLLFVPFFNLYWMFRAVPGLSHAIHRELRLLTPRRASSAGWVPGVIACIVGLIPYAQPIAFCIFVAWMLIANSALQRLIRLNEQWLDEEDEDVRENARH